MNGMSYTQPLAARSGTPLAAVHNSCSIFIDDTRVDNIQDGTVSFLHRVRCVNSRFLIP